MHGGMDPYTPCTSIGLDAHQPIRPNHNNRALVYESGAEQSND